MNRPDPRDIRAMERHQQDQLVQEQLTQGQQAADLVWIMSQEQGRRFMARLLEMSGLDRDSFTGSSATFYNEGARSIGVKLLAEIKVLAWDEYIAMLKEQRK